MRVSELALVLAWKKTHNSQVKTCPLPMGKTELSIIYQLLRSGIKKYIAWCVMHSKNGFLYCIIEGTWSSPWWPVACSEKNDAGTQKIATNHHSACVYSHEVDSPLTFFRFRVIMASKVLLNIRDIWQQVGKYYRKRWKIFSYSFTSTSTWISRQRTLRQRFPRRNSKFTTPLFRRLENYLVAIIKHINCGESLHSSTVWAWD